MSASRSPLPILAPESIKETCFFWYHGQCRLGEACHKAHETHITWPIPSPPGYVHYDPCALPLCPLRQDLVEFNRRSEEPDASPTSLICKVEETCFFWYHDGHCRRGADCGRAHDARITWPITPPPRYVHRKPCYLPLCPLRLLDMPGGDEPFEREKKNLQLVGARSNNIASSGMRGKSTQETGSVKDSPRQHTADIMVIEMSSSSETGKSDESRSDHAFDTSKGSNSSKSEGLDTDHCSEPGEINDGISVPRSSPRNGVEDGDKERQVLSISHANTLARSKRKASNDQTSPDSNKRSRLPSHIPVHQREHFSQPAASVYCSLSHTASPHRPLRTIQSLDERPGICFYWYHKGYCRPRHGQDGNIVRCSYLHTSEGPEPQWVSLPPNVDHSADCSLKLCPVRLAALEKTDSFQDAMPSRNIEHESPKVPALPAAVQAYGAAPVRSSQLDRTPPQVRYEGFKFGGGRQPLSHFNGARRGYAKGPNRPPRYPALLSADDECKRFYDAKGKIEKWQATHSKHVLNKPESRRHPQRRQLAPPKRRKGTSKKYYQMVAETNISGTEDESVKRKAPWAMGRYDAKKMKAEHDQIASREIGQEMGIPHQVQQEVQQEVQQAQVPVKKFVPKLGVLVDYHLPEGEDRMDWDTNCVRHTFGEIDESR